MSKQETLPKPPVRPETPRSHKALVPTATAKWAWDCVADIESNFHRLASWELPANASEHRKCMLSAALKALADRDLSWDELIGVLGSPETNFFKQSTPGQDFETAVACLIATLDLAICEQLERLEQEFIDIAKTVAAPFESQGTLLFLVTSTQELEPAYGSQDGRCCAVPKIDTLDVGAELAEIALRDGTAISWMPTLDPRFRSMTSEASSCHATGSMVATRVDGFEREPLGVLLVRARSVPSCVPTAMAQDELLQALPVICEPLRMLVVRSHLAKGLAGQFVTQGPQAHRQPDELWEECDATSQIEELYDELARLNSAQIERPGEIGIQKRIHECLASLRRLQEEEAGAMERHFAQGLSLPLGESSRLMKTADQLLHEYANIARPDITADPTDG